MTVGWRLGGIPDYPQDTNCLPRSSKLQLQHRVEEWLYPFGLYLPTTNSRHSMSASMALFGFVALVNSNNFDR